MTGRAGVGRTPAAKRWTDEQLLAAYVAGRSVLQVAKASGRSSRTVRGVVNAAGAMRPTRGGYRVLKPLPQDELARLRRAVGVAS